MQFASLRMRSSNAHLHTHTHRETDGTAFGRSLGFSIMPMDTLACGPEEPGIELPIFKLVDDPLEFNQN